VGDLEEMFDELYLSALDEGDVVNVQIDSGQYCLEVLEASNGLEGLKIGVTHERRFPNQVEVVSVGVLTSGVIEPTLHVGRAMVILLQSAPDKPKEYPKLTTSPVQRIYLIRA
jgi:hypothetical protein